MSSGAGPERSPPRKDGRRREGSGTRNWADGLRILIAYEANFRAHGDALERGIKEGLRPHVHLAVADLEVLEAAVECFDPHLVVSDGPNKVDPGGRAAWYRLSPEPGDPSEVCLDARRSISENPGLEEVLAVIDRVEELLRTGREPGGC